MPVGSVDRRRTEVILARARAEGRDLLLETEGLDLVASLGMAIPEHVFVAGSAEVARADLGVLGSEHVAVKVVAPGLIHKTEAGGVRKVRNDRREVAAAVAEMSARFGVARAASPGTTGALGFLLCAWIDYDPSPGGELLVGLRSTPDFGPVVCLGLGGLAAEHLGQDLAIFSPTLPATEIAPDLGAGPLRLATGSLRGRPPRIAPQALKDLLGGLLDVAASCLPDPIAELEINPLALTDRGPVVLDVLVRLGGPPPPPDPPRPREALRRLLHPRSMAFLGVSERHRNPGRIALDNTLDAGFDRSRISVIKGGPEEIAGCRCVPDLASLSGPVDVVVVAIDAAQVPPVVEDIVAGGRAESLIVIPGGLGEREGTEDRVGRLRAVVAAARAAGRSAVINGGNCLGIRSRPGRYDTLFIPRHKLPAPDAGPGGRPAPLAIVSQSGAFAVARASKLARLDPLYLVSIGNQVDLTVGDYLACFAEEAAVEVAAFYVEGFRPGDGVRFLAAARRMAESGRDVILYRAGRTAEGARATASHTASLAGDYAVTRELCRRAGVVVADSLADFDDLVRLFCLLRGREVGHRPPGESEGARCRLGAVSNAGFECVAVADSLGSFAAPAFAPETSSRLAALLRRHRLEGIVGVGNPLDVTPILGDDGFLEAARLVLADPGVDVGLVGCVPLTGAMGTLPAGPGHREDIHAAGSLVGRLGELWESTAKAWVAVVDAGELYDPLAAALGAAGLPTFRTADRALRLLDLFCRHRTGRSELAPE